MNSSDKKQYNFQLASHSLEIKCFFFVPDNHELFLIAQRKYMYIYLYSNAFLQNCFQGFAHSLQCCDVIFTNTKLQLCHTTHSVFIALT